MVPAAFIDGNKVVKGLSGLLTVLRDDGFADDEMLEWLFTPDPSLPGTPAHKRVTSPGQGPVLSFMDSGTVYDRELFELLRNLAQQYEIPWQTKDYISGGNDAAAIQRTRAGVRVAVISAPVRYLHTPSGVACISDITHMRTLARKFIEAIAAPSNQ